MERNTGWPVKALNGAIKKSGGVGMGTKKK
jgi:hypothetical protein